MIVKRTDFRGALNEVEPSAMREVLVELPKISWDDVGGLQDAKDQVQESVEWPLSNPERFDRLGVDPPAGVLLYGPPGTGKTLMAKAVANETNANFISVRGPQRNSRSGSANRRRPSDRPSARRGRSPRRSSSSTSSTRSRRAGAVRSARTSPSGSSTSS